MASVINRTTLQFIPTVNTPDYSAVDWIINPDLSGVEGVPKYYWKIVGDYVVEMDQAEKDVVDEEELPGFKQEKIDAIDDRTSELICEGYEFDGKIFDTDPNAQFNWKNMFDLTNAGILPFPVATCTKFNMHYEFVNQDSVNAFYLGGVGHIQGELASGRALKYQVLACTTKAEVDAIVDPR